MPSLHCYQNTANNKVSSLTDKAVVIVFVYLYQYAICMMVPFYTLGAKDFS